jgi:hypothetical protein
MDGADRECTVRGINLRGKKGACVLADETAARVIKVDGMGRQVCMRQRANDKSQSGMHAYGPTEKSHGMELGPQKWSKSEHAAAT